MPWGTVEGVALLLDSEHIIVLFLRGWIYGTRHGSRPHLRMTEALGRSHVPYRDGDI